MTDTTVDTSAVADATTQDVTAAATTNTDTQAVVADKATTTSVLDTTTDEGKTVPATWPEDWRDKLSKGDEKALKQFSRYASPEAMAEALIAAQKRISQGELGPKKPGKDSTPEEIAAYRELQGVPDKPEAYFDKLPNGLVIGENDKPFFDKFAALMHEDNVPKGTMEKVVDWYYKEIVEGGAQEQYEANAEAKRATEDVLRQEYGAEYRAHLSGINNLLASLPDGAGQILADAVGPDGISLFNRPEVVRAMVHLVNEVNPTASVIPGGSTPAAMESRLAELKGIMTNDRPRWFAEPKLHEEYQTIVRAKEKLQSRA